MVARCPACATMLPLRDDRCVVCGAVAAALHDERVAGTGPVTRGEPPIDWAAMAVSRARDLAAAKEMLEVMLAERDAAVASSDAAGDIVEAHAVAESWASRLASVRQVVRRLNEDLMVAREWSEKG